MNQDDRKEGAAEKIVRDWADSITDEAEASVAVGGKRPNWVRGVGLVFCVLTFAYLAYAVFLRSADQIYMVALGGALLVWVGVYAVYRMARRRKPSHPNRRG